MAITITDSQGTKAHLVAVATYANREALITAIAAGDNIGCIQDIGDIATSRSVQEYSCLSSDEIVKSLGSITLPSVDMSLLFDASDVTGQAELRAMFATNSRRVLVIELPDGEATLSAATAGQELPTSIHFEVAVSKFGANISKDNAVMQSVTLEICSKPTYYYKDGTVKSA